VYVGQGEGFKLTTELCEKVQYSHNQAITNGVNEAILLIWIKEALLKKKVCLSSNQDVILNEGDPNFKRATRINTPIIRACWRENKLGDPTFISFFKCSYDEC